MAPQPDLRLLNALSFAVIVTTVDGVIRHANQAALSLLRRRHSLDGARLTALGVDRLALAQALEVWSTATLPTPARLVFDSAVPDEPHIALLVRGARLSQPAGAPPLLCLELRPMEHARRQFADLSAQVEALNRALRQEQMARAEAERAVGDRSTFVAVAAHELRNPLNAIIGYSQLLQVDLHGPLGDRRYYDYLGHILAAASYLKDLLNSMLDASALETGHMEVHPVPVALAPVLKEIAEVFRGQAIEKGIALRPQRLDDRLFALADQRMTRQMIINVVINAIKYCPHDSVVTMETGVQGGMAQIIVADNGHGIPPEKMRVLTQAFTRGTHNGEGAGLGLYLVSKLAEANGGRMDIQSLEGQGTTVLLSLPLAQSASPAAPTVDTAPVGDVKATAGTAGIGLGRR